MARAGRQVQAIARPELDRPSQLGEAEPDRAGDADEHLVVAVLVRRVPIERSVGPRAGREALPRQPVLEVSHSTAGRGHRRRGPRRGGGGRRGGWGGRRPPPPRGGGGSAPRWGPGRGQGPPPRCRWRAASATTG